MTPSDRLGRGTSLASIIAGESSYEYGKEPVVLRAIAPRCKILSVNVFDEAGQATELNVIAALRYIQALNDGGESIQVHGVLVALELSQNVANYACGASPVCLEADRMVHSGVVVVVPAGNSGFDRGLQRSVVGTIGDPGNAKDVLTVGSTHRILPEVYGPSYFSSRGPTADGRVKPDLLAPGEGIDAVVVGELAQGVADSTQRQDGSEYAAAHVSGAIAGLLSVRPDLVGRPLEVKKRLTKTAVDLGRLPTYQGAGLVDMVGALRGQDEALESEPLQPVRIFCSYAHKDRALMEEFHAHLKPMERAGLIDLWWDRAIRPGTDWEEQIFERLDAAEIVVLLITAYFFASDYIDSKEMGTALKRGDQRIVPVIARDVDVVPTPIAHLQMLPDALKPITEFDDPHSGWAQVARELRDIVMDLRKDQRADST